MNFEPIVRFRGVVKNGKKVYYKPDAYSQLIKKLEGKEFSETLEEYDQQVTPDQHAYYRCCIRFLITEVEAYGGWTEQELHTCFAAEGLGYTVQRVRNGKLVDIILIPSLSEIGKKRMIQYIEWFISEVAKEGIVLPDSKDVLTRKYSTKISNAKTESR